MKITRAKLDRIIQEEYAKEARRQALKENVGIDMGSMFDVLEDIEYHANLAREALDNDDAESTGKR